MKVSIECQLELNRKWLRHKEGDEPYGELNFVISQPLFVQIYTDHFVMDWDDAEAFLSAYVPEEDGEKIYQIAKAQGAIIEEHFTPSEDEAHNFLKGHKTIEAKDFFFDGEIDQIDQLLNFYMVFTTNVDAIFGTHVETDSNDDFLNVYGYLDIERGTLEDALQICLWQGTDSFIRYYVLNDTEKAILLQKMDDYMLSVGEKGFACPLCGISQAIRIAERKEDTWRVTCRHCEGAYTPQSDAAGPELDAILEYCHAQKVVSMLGQHSILYCCGEYRSEESLYTVSSCARCSKQGCHIHTAAQDGELLLNGEKGVEDLHPFWRDNHGA